MSSSMTRKSTTRKTLTTGAIGLSMLLVSALAPAQQSTAGAMAAPAASGSMTSKVARADSAFMKQAAQNGNAEVEGSKLALTKSSNPQVKTFAQQMVDDHTKAGDELKALATSKGVEVSDKPSVTQTAQIKLLGALSGDTFDKRYASMIGVSAHQDTVKLFQKASMNAKDADVKGFAGKTLPTLQHHLQMAQDLKASVMGSKS